ncbi:lytic murein transglycosylase [uncultured Mailhella sp.]|uniref:lytic murein transglycosylase n=1 Tax=uncultured Mailhella sp. TaxID=1981031 RepID=UPI002602E809|nr:lytic murein transglycosylase [uncultured Mailhella sp.]
MPTAVGETLPAWQKTWRQLAERLMADGLDAGKTAALFAGLSSPPSAEPMGVKVRELYTGKFLSKAHPTKKAQLFQTKLGIPGPWFKGVVTQTNARLCKKFIAEHERAFALAEAHWGVPPETGAALLFVETRLGAYVGKHNAFFTLASMAVTKDPAGIPEYLDALPGSSERLPWIRERMEQKAEWAYTELKALLAYCYENALDPLTLKGSVYGAIGLCQFMPGNISRYAVDGDGDGHIDLYQAPDAIASLSCYLQRHGWKPGLSVSAQRKVLRRYNAMDIYARTILALARTIERLP